MTASLLPQGLEWLKNDFNALLVGLHGVGKTYTVRDLCAEAGLKLKYFSCATMDPFTDLTGVPVPTEPDPVTGKRGLEYVRPREIDEAEVIFFDEFNRADPRVHNAVLEIIQFGTINGERLPNLRCVWAAMNPPGKSYNVEDLDPALVDRFDVYEELAPAPSVDYFVSVGIKPAVAQALCAWYREIDQKNRDESEMITARRLEKMGLVYQATGNVRQAIPLWFHVDRAKLEDMLRDATNREGTGSGDAAFKGFSYTKTYFEANDRTIGEYLGANLDDHETHTAAVKLLQTRQVGALIDKHYEVLNSLMPAKLETMFNEMANGKLRNLRDKLESMPFSRDPRDQVHTLFNEEYEKRGL